MHMDLLVIGNGALASSIAFRSKSSGGFSSVSLLGPSGRDGSASAAAGIMLNCFAEVDSGTLSNRYAFSKLALSHRALGAWPDWINELEHASGKKAPGLRSGTVVINNARADSMDEGNYSSILAALRQFNESFEEIDPSSIPGYSPNPRFRALKAMFIPREGSIDSHGMLRLLNDACEAIGVDQISEKAVSIKRRGGALEVMLASGKHLYPKTVVLAAGAYTYDLLAGIPELQSAIPRVFYGTGIGIRFTINRAFGDQTTIPSMVVRTPNRGNACGVHCVPYSKDSGYVGASNHLSTMPELSPRISALGGILSAAASEVNRGFGMANVVPTIGHRPTSADTFPLLGRTSVPNLWLATGTKRDGFHQSPLLSEAFTKALLGDPSALPTEFQPERKLLLTLTRTEGIEQAVAHRISGAIQHDLALPTVDWEEKIRETIRREVEAIYDRLQLERGVPPELLNMVAHGHIPAEQFRMTSGTMETMRRPVPRSGEESESASK